MIRVLHDNPTYSALFMEYLLTRNIRIQEGLVDQLFNSAEKRLARVLLLMAHFGKESKHEPISVKLREETLAEMIGTTRSRVSFFLNKFRKLDFYRVQRRDARAQLPPQCRSPRLDSLLNATASVQ